MRSFSDSLKNLSKCLILAGAVVFRCNPASALNPIITVPPLSTSVQLGGSASFTVIAISIPAMTYQWLSNGIPLAGATAVTYSLSNVQLSEQATYSVEVFNGGPSTMEVSSGATLTITNIPPSATSQPQSVVTTNGGAAAFSVIATGTAPLNYQWTFGGTNISGATGSSLSFASLATTNAGSYAVVINNSCGTVTSSVATLTVVLPPTITTQPVSQRIVIGNNVSLSVAASNSPAYQWLFNGAPLVGATNSSISLIGVQTNYSGNYSVVLTNLAGSVTSSNATVIVIPHFSLATMGGAGRGVSSNGYSFQFSVPAGCMYVISASTDMVNWTPIATNTASTGNITFTDAAALSYRGRFYRAQVW